MWQTPKVKLLLSTCPNHALVEGQDDSTIVAGLSQGLGQAAGHIGQTRRFCRRGTAVRTRRIGFSWGMPP